MNVTAIKAIVFDLDGTLINTAPDVRLALNHMLSQYHLPQIKGDEVYDLIGWGAATMIQKAFAKFGARLSPADLAAAKACYLQFYREHPVVESYIYPNVTSVLDELRKDGMRFGICTNKPNVMTHLVLEQFEIKNYFHAIVAGDEITRPKPHGQHILDVLSKMDCDSQSAVMVGDSDIDKASANHAGIHFIGVTYGYSKIPMSANILIDHFRELPKIIHSGLHHEQ